jgi:hypothetical protein
VFNDHHGAFAAKMVQKFRQLRRFEVPA